MGESAVRRAARDLLRELHVITGQGEYLFPAVLSVRRPMSDNTLNAALRRLGYAKEEVSVSGFRATASTLLNEMGRWNPDAIERQLEKPGGLAIVQQLVAAFSCPEQVRALGWMVQRAARNPNQVEIYNGLVVLLCHKR